MRTFFPQPARRRAGLVISIITAAGLLASCAGAPQPEFTEDTASSAGDAFPVTIENCGRTVTVPEPPERAVALTGEAAMTLVALGLADRVVGISYAIPTRFVGQKWRKAYKSLPVISDKYPSKEAFLAVKPDFAYSALGSAFEAKNVGTREELAAHGIPSYLSPVRCPLTETRPDSWDMVWREITEIGRIFGVPERAEQLVQHQQQMLERVRQESPGEGITVFWYDLGTKNPLTPTGGAPQLILEAVGATNVFGHLDGTWVNVSWEQVVAADPEVIVLTNANYSTAEEKIAYLESDPVLSQLSAVQNDRYIEVSVAFPGVRLVRGAKTVAEQLAEFQELGTS